jgi:alkylation response protein AidB-like acyl-CoA dehydrogenase
VAAGLSVGGTCEQKQRYLPGLLDGTSTAGWAFAESQGRWAADAVTTTASPDGDAIVINGIKDYVEGGAAADLFIVVAATGGGLTQVLVSADSPGVTVEQERSLDLTQRFARVRFDGVRVPITTGVLGQVGRADDDVERLLRIALTLQCAESAGAMDRVFEFTFAYMGQRYAFGRPISSYQALKHRVADLLLQLESAKATSDGAARAVDAAEPEAGRLVRVAAAYVGDTAPSFVQECVQLLGGIGVTWEHDIHLYLRRVTLNRAILGTPEHHREQICIRLGVAKTL